MSRTITTWRRAESRERGRLGSTRHHRLSVAVFVVRPRGRFRRVVGHNVRMASTGTMDGRAVVECQVDGCSRKIKTTMGALRRRRAILRCPAGHENVIDGRQFDQDIRDFERDGKRRIFK